MNVEFFNKIKVLSRSPEPIKKIISKTKDLTGDDLQQAVKLFATTKQHGYSMPLTPSQVEEIFNNQVCTAIAVPIPNGAADLSEWDWTVTAALQIPGAQLIGDRSTQKQLQVTTTSIKIDDVELPLDAAADGIWLCSYRMGRFQNKYMTAFVAVIPSGNVCYQLYRPFAEARQVVNGRKGQYVTADGQEFSFAPNGYSKNYKGNVPVAQDLRPITRDYAQYLYVNHSRVHRDVALAFVANTAEYPVLHTDCCHRNGNEIDNRAVNLEWGTHNYNIKYSIVQRAIMEALPGIDVDSIVDDLRAATLDIIDFERNHDKQSNEAYKLKIIAKLTAKLK